MRALLHVGDFKTMAGVSGATASVSTAYGSKPGPSRDDDEHTSHINALSHVARNTSDIIVTSIITRCHVVDSKRIAAPSAFSHKKHEARPGKHHKQSSHVVKIKMRDNRTFW